MVDSHRRDCMEQIKSKQRVEDHDEVFTSEREVNAMLDLVKQETERIDSRFLEPAIYVPWKIDIWLFLLHNLRLQQSETSVSNGLPSYG